MPVLRSNLDPTSETAKADREAVLAKLAQIDELPRKARDGGGRTYADRHRARGKLLARARLDLLLDEDSAFRELGALAGAHDPGEAVGGVSGIGTVADGADPADAADG